MFRYVSPSKSSKSASKSPVVRDVLGVDMYGDVTMAGTTLTMMGLASGLPTGRRQHWMLTAEGHDFAVSFDGESSGKGTKKGKRRSGGSISKGGRRSRYLAEEDGIEETVETEVDTPMPPVPKKYVPSSSKGSKTPFRISGKAMDGLLSLEEIGVVVDNDSRLHVNEIDGTRGSKKGSPLRLVGSVSVRGGDDDDSGKGEGKGDDGAGLDVEGSIEAGGDIDADGTITAREAVEAPALRTDTISPTGDSGGTVKVGGDLEVDGCIYQTGSCDLMMGDYRRHLVTAAESEDLEAKVRALEGELKELRGTLAALEAKLN